VRLANVHHRVVQRPGLEERVPHELEERYDDEREHAFDERERLAEPLERFGRPGAAGRGVVDRVRAIGHRLPLVIIIVLFCSPGRGGRVRRRLFGHVGRFVHRSGQVKAVRLPTVPAGRAVVAH